MAAKLSAFQKDIHMRKTGAKKNLEDFITNRALIVKTILKVFSQSFARQMKPELFGPER
jgi:hypothetical protein